MNTQEGYRTTNRIRKINYSYHIKIKTPNALNKERILKAVRQKGQVTYIGKPIRITPDFSSKTMNSRNPRQMSYRLKRKSMPAQATIPSKTLNYD